MCESCKNKANESARKYMKKWKKINPEKSKKRAKKWRNKWAGTSEFLFRNQILSEFSLAISLDDNRPDFYDPKNKYFIEIKRALPFRRCLWTYESPEFPGLFFAKRAKNVRTPIIDEQIARYPKPLLVIIIHALTGNEIIRKIYYDKNNEVYPHYISDPIKIIPEINLTEICPDCKGKGQIEQQSDMWPNVVIPSTTVPIPRMVMCRRCNGSGKINSGDTYCPDYYPRFPYLTTDPIQPNVC